MNTKMLFLSLFLFTSVSTFFVSSLSAEEGFGNHRSKVLSELSLAIDDAVRDGLYECCIDPPCTMCYLGNWIWDDGICRCDEMIAKGELDKVCPQCSRGLEDGICRGIGDSVREEATL